MLTHKDNINFGILFFCGMIVMNKRSLAFIGSKFKEYYHRAVLTMPLKFEKREWGFVSFDVPGMRRHKAFKTKKEAISFLKGEGPRHVYYSSAIYSAPSAPKMIDKGWEGAELIFDLDADHLQAHAESFEEMLKYVKIETTKLLKFLEDDFGFSEDEMDIVFSGGRGYHVHIYHPKVWDLQSPERREIVDYISARGLEMDKIVSIDQYGSTIIIPSSTWGERLHHGFVEFMEEISRMEKDEAIRYLKGLGLKDLGKKRAIKLIEVANDENLMGEIKNGNIMAVKNFPTEIWKEIIEERKKVKLGEVDEPVTADIKRLIRLPTSLHGGTGLRVTPLTMDEFKGFDPLVDAVAFDEDKIVVDLASETSIKLADENYSLNSGINEVPEAVGIFLICKGLAEFKGVT